METLKSFHKNFRIQGKSFSEVSELLKFSKTISIEVYTFLVDWFNKEKFVEVQTSGSTGKPKTIQLKKVYLKNSALATGTFFNLMENTTALLCMPANYIAGKMMLVRALELGWHLDVVEPASNPLKALTKNYDFCAMVPLQLHHSLNEMHKVKKLIVGGGIVSNELLENIQDIQTEVFATYGMTETSTHIAVKKLNNFCHSERSLSDVEMRTEEDYYQVLPNVKISQDARNCLVINAPKVSEDKIITNDIVKIHSATAFEWLGRFDTIINSGGLKLIPEQIENKLSQLIKERFFVYGLPDAILGEKLVLIVESDNETVILSEVKNLKSLSKFEQPKEIFFIPKFMDTPTEKINRSKTVDLLNLS